MLKAYALPAILIAVGLQLLRVMFPSLAWYMMDVVGVPSLNLAPYALGAFAPAFLSPLLWRLLGQRRALWFTCSGLLLSRAVEQVAVDPGVDLWASLVGTAFFALFLPLWTAHLRAQRGSHSDIRWSGGILLGLALDTLIKGATDTLDLSWISGPLPVIGVLALVGAGFLLLRRETFPVGQPASDARWKDALPLIGLGLYLLLQANLFQNQGWVAEVAQIGPQLAFLLMMLGNALAALSITWALSRPSLLRPAAGLIVGAALVGVVALAGSAPPLPPIWPLLGQALMGWALALIGTVSTVEKRPGISASSTWMGIGLVLFVVLNFIYYAGLDIRIPIPRASIFPAAAVILSLAVLAASLRAGQTGRKPWSGRTLSYVALLLIAFPLLELGLNLTARPDASLPADDENLVVMTYNIHSAYNVFGRQDPEAIAQVIEAQGADVIGLQEISRGWLINGTTDLVGWLSARLDMYVVFQGTSDLVWGNAILTRTPPTASGRTPLPQGDGLIRRGVQWVNLEWNDLRFLNTHLHHPADAGPLRVRQASVILDRWDERPHSVLVGDLNAEPPSDEIRLLLSSGFEDAWFASEEGQGYTYSSTSPVRRIDWILHTADLTATQTRVISSPASDHLPVITVLQSGE